VWPWCGFVLRSLCLVYAYYMALRWLWVASPRLKRSRVRDTSRKSENSVIMRIAGTRLTPSSAMLRKPRDVRPTEVWSAAASEARRRFPGSSQSLMYSPVLPSAKAASRFACRLSPRRLCRQPRPRCGATPAQAATRSMLALRSRLLRRPTIWSATWP
jgi:hypothetical protein